MSVCFEGIDDSVQSQRGKLRGFNTRLATMDVLTLFAVALGSAEAELSRVRDSFDDLEGLARAERARSSQTHVDVAENAERDGVDGRRNRQLVRPRGMISDDGKVTEAGQGH